MNLPHGVDGPALLLAIALVGRVLLALLPPGLPGRHAPSDLPATWGASHLLGSLALSVEAGVLALLRLDPSPAVFLAPWLLLAVARWLTLPGAIVPRSELPREASGALARTLCVAAALAVVAAAVVSAPEGHRAANVLRAADALALLALVAFGLAAARRAPVARAATVLVLAGILGWTIASERATSLTLSLAVGGGISLGVPWLRRADRRAGALAVLAYALAASLGPREALFGLAGILALWIHTAVPSRSLVATFAASTWIPAAALGWSRRTSGLELESVLPALGALTFVVAAAALSTRHRLLLAREGGKIDSGRLGSSMLRDALVLSILPPIARGEIGSFEILAASMLPIAPILVLDAGILLGRAEAASR